ncbi:MAG: ABC transporter ATP-binding protein [Candidatus Limnocylindrales bacterium]
MSEPVIAVEHLRKTYGPVVAVDDISFEVREGEIFGLLGPNGAGKTTTVECIQGLRKHDSVRVRVLDLDPDTDAPALRRSIGSQLQQSALPDRVRVWEALDLFAAFAPRRVDWRALMAAWGLEPLAGRAYGSLSGGQRQRLLIALALVNAPRVVFLDEMTTGLDPAARRTTWDLIREVRDRGCTIVLVTHFMEEAERLCDRVAIIDAGRIVATGSPQALIASEPTGVRVLFSTPVPDLRFIEAVAHVRGVHRTGEQVEVEGTGPVLALVAAALVAQGILPDDLRVERPTLEDVFLRLTGHSMRD